MNPEIILGSPGTGKTSALLDIVEEELARGTPPDRIAYVTFTRRAAEEAVTRACAKFNLAASAFPHFRTIHSTCYRALGLRRGDVMEGKRVQEFADYVGVRVTGRASDDGTLEGFEPGDRALHMDNLARVRCRPLRAQYDEDDDGLPWNLVSRVSRALRAFKDDQGLLDYTDMLEEFLRAGARPRIEVLLVDEGQDQPLLQWRVVDALAASPSLRRFVVGADDDQCIFRWSGADVDYLVDLPGTVRVLGQSWRVPPLLQELARGLIGRVRRRRPKEWAPRAGRGELARAGRFADVGVEGEWDATGGANPVQPVLVLARNTYVLREQVEPELRRRGVVYERRGRPSVDPGLLEAITAWERLRAGGAASPDEVRTIYAHMTAGRGVARGSKTLPGLAPEAASLPLTIEDLRRTGGLLTDAIWHEALDRLPRAEVGYIVAARRRGEKLRARPRVRISTIHGAKGGEAEHVVLMKEVARRTAREGERAPDDELRVWYVGATRAREKLTLVESSTAQGCLWL